jgi:GntR family transcriptional repressor for pyruvate dehydrogenase complex
MSELSPLPNQLQVRRIRKASDQVADQLRSLILEGKLSAGAKLPIEQELAKEFGVSRATMREALAGLASEGLLRTAKGVKGGRFVITPSPDRVSNTLGLAVTLLSQSNGVTLDDLLEVRMYLELPATRLAAERRRDVDVDAMRKSIPSTDDELASDAEFVHNREFHKAVLEASYNTLLVIAAQPVFTVLQTRLARSRLGHEFHTAIHAHHQEIAEAIAAGDADESERRMRTHLEWLRPKYEQAWTDLRQQTDR